MKIYYAYKYHSTMTCNTFVHITTNSAVLDTAKNLFFNVLHMDNNEAEYESLENYIKANNIIALNDCNGDIEIKEIRNGFIKVTDFITGIVYTCKILYSYTNRF